MPFRLSARHHEEDLRKKLEAMDNEYMRSVDMTNRAQNEIFHNERPETVKALKDLVLECDSSLTLQLQKFGIKLSFFFFFFFFQILTYRSIFERKTCP